MILTQEKILEYAKLEEAIKERCEAFLGPSFHLTNFEINDTHISIWGEDDHREPFTDYCKHSSTRVLQHSILFIYVRYMLDKRNEGIKRIREEKQKKLLQLEFEKEQQDKKEYERLKKKFE
jgi:hypothetical protein